MLLFYLVLMVLHFWKIQGPGDNIISERENWEVRGRKGREIFPVNPVLSRFYTKSVHYLFKAINES